MKRMGRMACTLNGLGEFMEDYQPTDVSADTAGMDYLYTDAEFFTDYQPLAVSTATQQQGGSNMFQQGADLLSKFLRSGGGQPATIGPRPVAVNRPDYTLPLIAAAAAIVLLMPSKRKS